MIRHSSSSEIFIQEEDQDKKRSRAERFQTDSPAPVVDEETKQKRIDRFGVVTPSVVSARLRGDRVPRQPISALDHEERKSQWKICTSDSSAD